MGTRITDSVAHLGDDADRSLGKALERDRPPFAGACFSAPRRRGLLALGTAGALGALGALAPAIAWAQEFPARPLRIVVPFGAGTTTDIVTRVIAEGMARPLGQSALSRTAPAPAAPSVQTWWPKRRPTATAW